MPLQLYYQISILGSMLQKFLFCFVLVSLSSLFFFLYLFFLNLLFPFYSQVPEEEETMNDDLDSADITCLNTIEEDLPVYPLRILGESD